MKNFFRALVILIIQFLTIPALASIVWNTIAREFNLPTFNMWIFTAIMAISWLFKEMRVIARRIMKDMG